PGQGLVSALPSSSSGRSTARVTRRLVPLASRSEAIQTRKRRSAPARRRTQLGGFAGAEPERERRHRPRRYPRGGRAALPAGWRSFPRSPFGDERDGRDRHVRNVGPPSRGSPAPAVSGQSSRRVRGGGAALGPAQVGAGVGDRDLTGL